MKESMRTYALWAEIASSVIVVVSVIFLVFEIRENTQTIKRASYDAITESLIEWRRDQYIDPALRALFLKRENEEALSEAESRSFRMLGVNLYQNYERAFWANQYNQMGSSEWERFSRNICAAKDDWWSPVAAAFSTREFVDFVDSCSD